MEQRDHRTSSSAEAALLARTPPVITPGHGFNSVTDTISHVVLTKRTPIGWFLGFFVAFCLLMVSHYWCPPSPCSAAAGVGSSSGFGFRTTAR